MKLPIDVLEKVNAFVEQLDEESHLTSRQEAIRETARLLVYLTNAEFYGDDNLCTDDYLDISAMCDDFIYQR